MPIAATGALSWSSDIFHREYTNAAHVRSATVFEQHGTDCTDRTVYDAAHHDYRGVSGSVLIDAGRDSCSPFVSNLMATVPFPRHGAHYDIGRFEWFADVPFVDITTTPFTVMLPTSYVNIAGTNDAVVGSMWWSNVHASAGGSLIATPAWTIANIPLVSKPISSS